MAHLKHDRTFGVRIHEARERKVRHGLAAKGLKLKKPRARCAELGPYFVVGSEPDPVIANKTLEEVEDYLEMVAELGADGCEPS